MKISPQIFRKSTSFKTPGEFAIQWKKSENIHCESLRKLYEDHESANNFDSPSYRKCHPIAILRIIKNVCTIAMFLNFIVFSMVILIFVSQGWIPCSIKVRDDLLKSKLFSTQSLLYLPFNPLLTQQLVPCQIS
jgi:hypothetical protein